MKDYKARANAWINSNKLTEDEKTYLSSLDDKKLEELFYTDLEFGTGGMRGIMDLGTNRMNRIIIQKVTLGFAKYLLMADDGCKEHGVVIAHDNRNNGEEFAKATADVLTSLGIKVYLFDSLRPTPELSFAIRYLSCAGGINITASHNPKEYNGYKIYNDEGNQLILEQSDIVMKNIAEIGDELLVNVIPDDSLIEILDSRVDDAFIAMVRETSVNKKMEKSNIKIVYSPQHGTGYVPVTRVLKEEGYNVIEVKEQCFPSKTFENTKSPNPENKQAYDLALIYANKENADIIITNDPDCDRVGIVVFDKNRTPHYLTGNQTAPIIIDYYFNALKELNRLPNNGIMYDTIVTSPLGEKVAASYGVVTKQTLTGFKYIGDEIQKTNMSFLLGFEESYGYLFNSKVRDKDGVQAAMIISEMTSYYAHKGKTLLDVLEAIRQKFGYFVDDQYNFFAEGIKGPTIIANIMDTLRNSNFKEILDYKVIAFEDYKMGKRYDKDGTHELDYERSNVLRYILEDGSFIAIRPSGTEPKCKFYFSITDVSYEKALEKHDRIKEFFISFAHE